MRVESPQPLEHLAYGAPHRRVEPGEQVGQKQDRDERDQLDSVRSGVQPVDARRQEVVQLRSAGALERGAGTDRGTRQTSGGHGVEVALDRASEVLVERFDGRVESGPAGIESWLQRRVGRVGEGRAQIAVDPAKVGRDRSLVQRQLNPVVDGDRLGRGSECRLQVAGPADRLHERRQLGDPLVHDVERVKVGVEDQVRVVTGVGDQHQRIGEQLVVRVERRGGWLLLLCRLEDPRSQPGPFLGYLQLLADLRVRVIDGCDRGIDGLPRRREVS